MNCDTNGGIVLATRRAGRDVCIEAMDTNDGWRRVWYAVVAPTEKWVNGTRRMTASVAQLDGVGSVTAAGYRAYGRFMSVLADTIDAMNRELA